MYVVMYLTAIVIANLTIVWFGPGWSVINAFLFIGLDLTARDSLHEQWEGNNLWVKMTLLIAGGSLLSYAINRNSGQIALASFLSFMASGIVDTVIYHILRGKEKLLKINGSNMASAAVDSITFPALAFGFPLMFGIMVGQFVAKVGGGFLWSLVLHNKNKLNINNRIRR